MKKLLLSLHFFTLLLLTNNENLFSMNKSKTVIEEKNNQTRLKKIKKNKKRKDFHADSDQETNNENLFSMNKNKTVIEEKNNQTPPKKIKKNKKRKDFHADSDQETDQETITKEKDDYLILTKKELEERVNSEFKKNTQSEYDLLKKFAEINNTNAKDKNQETEIVLTFYKNKNDSNPTFLITTFPKLLDKTSQWKQIIPKKVAQLHVYIFTFKPINFKKWDGKLEKDIEKTKKTAEKFRKKIQSLFPKIKNLSVNLSSFCPQHPYNMTPEEYHFYFQLQNKAKTIFIMSLLDKNWTSLKSISIDPGTYSLRDKRLLKIFDQLSNISSLQSVILSGENNTVFTGATGLKSVAQHALIKKLKTLTLFFNPAYIDNENLETIRSLFQQNIAQNTTITLKRSTTLFDNEQQFKDIIITKNKKDSSKNKNSIQAINITNLEDIYAKYEIHLTWINSNKCNYFAKDEETTNKIIKAASGWAKKNPTAKVFIWYDSMFIKNLSSVKKSIKKQVKEKSSNISLIDIRKLKRVTKNPKVFSDNLPVYFRADLVREIIIYESLSAHKSDCIIYADIDMTPLTQKQLFDIETVDLLNRYGLILARVPGDPDKPYENSFQMVVNNKKTTKAIKHILINTNIEIAKEYLNPPSTGDMNKDGYSDCYKINLPQFVYRLFPAMFYYFYFLNGMATIATDAKITITNDEKKNKDNINKEMVRLFWELGGTRVGKSFASYFELNKGLSEFYPTKLVKIPPIGGKYY